MKMNKPIVINLFGGPGIGKSTIAALLFGKLKQNGYNAELVMEYAKDKVWEESYKTLENQIYVFGKQLHRIWRLKDKVDFIITDSPLLLSIIYDKENDQNLKSLVLSSFNKFNNKIYLLKRQTEYQKDGRLQTEEEAKNIDKIIEDLLSETGVEYKICYNLENIVNDIYNECIEI
jgi:hypothetical protein